MKLAIIGSRSLQSFHKAAILAQIPSQVTHIISGGAKGVDTLAEEIAAELGIPVIKLLPNYERFGKKAPLLRNDDIVGLADEVLAIWDFKSRGTAYVIAQCIEQQVPVRTIGPDG